MKRFCSLCSVSNFLHSLDLTSCFSHSSSSLPFLLYLCFAVADAVGLALRIALGGRCSPTEPGTAWQATSQPIRATSLWQSAGRFPGRRWWTSLSRCSQTGATVNSVIFTASDRYGYIIVLLISFIVQYHSSMRPVTHSFYSIDFRSALNIPSLTTCQARPGPPSARNNQFWNLLVKLHSGVQLGCMGRRCNDDTVHGVLHNPHNALQQVVGGPSSLCRRHTAHTRGSLSTRLVNRVTPSNF